MRDLDLNLLWALEALLEEKSVTRAAARLGMSQPGMSLALRRLRLLFEDELLVRVGNQHSLTPFAESLGDEVQEILHGMDIAFKRRPAFDPSTGERTFSIAGSDYFFLIVVMPLIERLAVLAPKVSLELHALPPLTAKDLNLDARQIEAARIDLVFYTTSHGPDLPHEVLYTDRRVPAVWIGNASVGDSITREELASMSLVDFGRSITEVSTNVPGAKIAVSTESFLSMALALKGTNRVALVQEKLGRMIGDFAAIRMVEPLFEVSLIEEAMFWHPRQAKDPGHLWLRQEIRAVCSKL